MDIGRAFVFFLQDRTWPAKASVALLLLGVPSVVLTLSGFDPVSMSDGSSGGGLRNLLPVVILPLCSLPVFGYWMRIMQRVGVRDDVPLPRWSGGGDLLVDGLRNLGVTLAWLLLLFLTVACPLLALFAGVTAASGGGVPAWRPFGGSNWYATSLLTSLPGVVFGVFEAAALGRAAADGSFGAGVDVGAVFRSVRDYFRTYLVVSLVVTGINLFNTLILASPPVVGLFSTGGWLVGLAVASSVASVYTGCVTAHLYGQAYWVSQADVSSERSTLPPPSLDPSSA